MRPIPRSLCAVMIVGSFLSAEHSVSAQSAPAVPGLDTVKSLKCGFPRTVSVTEPWADAIPDVKVSDSPTNLIFQLDSIDVKSGRARLIGNLSAYDVSVIYHVGNLHIIESSASGSMHLLTVFPPEEGGAFRAVYSRHAFLVVIPGLVASQNYGSCQIWD